MSFQINKNIPIPPRTIPNAGPRQTKYPLDEMEAGDSFDVPVTDEKQARQKQSQFSSLAKTRGIKVVTRYLSGEKVLRVWHDGVAAQGEEGGEEGVEGEEAAEAGEPEALEL